MNAMRVRRALAIAFGGALLVVGAMLPVIVPTAETPGPPAPPSTPASPLTGTPTAGGASDVAGERVSGMTITQQFPAAGPQIASVALLLRADQRASRTTAQVSVQANTDGQWREIATRPINRDEIRDDARSSITFSPPLAVATGQSVRIVLQVGGGGDAIGWQANSSWKPDGYLLIVNGAEREGTARFQVAYAPASGRLLQMLDPIWGRMTVFLNPFWRCVLLLGLGLSAGGILFLGRALIA